ncbi:MAG: isopentenyl phosphate kinase [Patescibacteria group bacterium]
MHEIEQKKPIVLIKIGGSLITDKNKPFTVKERALNIIAGEVKKALESGKQLIIGHGAGSFAHVPAKKYQTHKGLLNDKSVEGIAQVANVVHRLNKIVMDELLDKGVNAVAVSPLSTMIAKNHQIDTISTEAIELAMSLNILPVVYGDQIFDREVGCTIFSTEKVLAYLGLELMRKGYKIERVIHCGQTNGVYDENGQTIPLINSKNFDGIVSLLGGSGGVDVTGGMLHKVEETLSLARQGIPGLIIDGIEHGTLSDAINGKDVLGTRIED